MSILKDLKTPSFYEEGFTEIDYENHVIRVSGLENGDRELTAADIKGMKKTVVNSRLTSVSGWSVRADWGGVLFSDFMEQVKPGAGANHVKFTSVGGYETAVSLADMAYPKAMLCYEAGGEILEPEYGGPVRVFIPHLWGYKSCKGLAKIEFTDEMSGGFWEDRGYPRDAKIKAGKTLDVNSGEMKEITGGEVTEF